MKTIHRNDRSKFFALIAWYWHHQHQIKLRRAMHAIQGTKKLTTRNGRHLCGEFEVTEQLVIVTIKSYNYYSFLLCPVYIYIYIYVH